MSAKSAGAIADLYLTLANDRMKAGLEDSPPPAAS